MGKPKTHPAFLPEAVIYDALLLGLFKSFFREFLQAIRVKAWYACGDSRCSCKKKGAFK
jgi:hypothetical protein